jgi:hypothetical protein
MDGYCNGKSRGSQKFLRAIGGETMCKWIILSVTQIFRLLTAQDGRRCFGHANKGMNGREENYIWCVHLYPRP